MNKKVFLISSILSILFSFCILKMYNALSTYKAVGYMIQIGAYNSLDNAINASHNYNYSFIMRDNNLYKVYLSMSLSEEAYERIVSAYDIKDTSFKKTIIIDDKDFAKKINSFDSAIMKSDSFDKIKMILKEEVNTIKDFYSLELIS